MDSDLERIWESDAYTAIAIVAGRVRADVESFLTTGHPVLSDQTWTVRLDGVFDTKKVSIVITINTDCCVVKQIFGLDANELQPEIKRVTMRLAAAFSRAVVPVLLRLTPRPPFIPGDAPPAG